jgi:HD superfamily phosphohydrolase
LPTFRDPLWNNIRVDEPFLMLVDSPVFQRLRYVRQLGLAHLVYPGATHTRFEHALGAYHLARETVRVLGEAGELEGVAKDERTLVVVAALLHDLGHYPFSHALEEIGIAHHEAVAGPLLSEGALGVTLRKEFGKDSPSRILDYIRGKSASPLQGLISGSIDLDKLDYLKRDAKMCGVPYGEIDDERLRHALTVVNDPRTGRLTIGLRDKGLSALESLLFAKYQMYRNVYWQHAVRSATAMYKRLVEDALATKVLTEANLVDYTDEGLLHALESAGRTPLLDAIKYRRLYKRAMEAPAAEVGDHDLDWLSEDRARTRSAEKALAKALKIPADELLLDYPRKERMIGLDLPLVAKDGTVKRITDEGLAGAINLPILGEQLYQSARWLRVFTAQRVEAPRERVLQVLAGT